MTPTSTTEVVPVNPLFTTRALRRHPMNSRTGLLVGTHRRTSEGTTPTVPTTTSGTDFYDPGTVPPGSTSVCLGPVWAVRGHGRLRSGTVHPSS